MKFYPLFEGSFSVGVSKKFIPFTAGVDDPKSRPGSIFIHVQPFLVESGNDLILLDTGLGQIDTQGNPMIWNHILNLGYAPSDITKVILSHLHTDHSLGLVHRNGLGSMHLNFPNADHFVQKGELEMALDVSNNSYPHEILLYFSHQANVHLIEGDSTIHKGIKVELTGGHCPYHQVILIQDEISSETLFFGGDVLPEGGQLIRNYVAKYDFDGRRSMELRKYYGELAAKENWTCLYYHDNSAKPYSKVELAENKGFRLF